MLNRDSENGNYLEGSVQIKYYLDGEDFTDTYTSYYVGTTSEVNTPEVIYCSSFKVDNYQLGSDGNRITDSSGNTVEGLSLYYKYYTITQNPYSKQQKTKAIVFPKYTGIKFDKILPGPSMLWSYSSDDMYHCGTAKTSGPIEVHFLTDEDARYNITVISSDTNRGNVHILPESSDGYKINEEVRITVGYWPGYHFSKWGVKKITSVGVEIDEGYIYEVPYVFNAIANRNYTAYFDPNDYNITRDDCNGKNPVTNVVATFGEEMPKVSIPNKTGYSFKGYYTEKTGGTKYYNSDGTSAKVCDFKRDSEGNVLTDGATITLYAQWELEEYKINYRYVESATNTNPSKYTIEDTPITFVDLTGIFPTGHKFTGWLPGEISTGSTGEKTIDAKWSPETYTITWDANEGSVSPTSTSYTYNSPAIEMPTPTREGYNFVGWFTDKTGGTQIIGIGGSNTNPSSDVTYYAHWSIKKISINVGTSPIGGGTTSGTGTYNWGTEVTISVNVNSEYQFKKWQDGNTNNPRVVIASGDSTHTYIAILEELPDITNVITLSNIELEPPEIDSNRLADIKWVNNVFFEPEKTEWSHLIKDLLKQEIYDNYQALSDRCLKYDNINKTYSDNIKNRVLTKNNFIFDITGDSSSVQFNIKIVNVSNNTITMNTSENTDLKLPNTTGFILYLRPNNEYEKGKNNLYKIEVPIQEKDFNITLPDVSNISSLYCYRIPCYVDNDNQLKKIKLNFYEKSGLSIISKTTWTDQII